MRKINKTLLVISMVFISLLGFSQQADDIIGKYHLPNKLDLEIYKVGDKYFGKIIGLNGFEDGQTTDVNNPDDSKQNQTLMGLVILRDLEWDQEEKHWVNGIMYGPEKGMLFNLKITKIMETKIEVVGSKYLFWHTLEWSKID